jgi:hypothetical protein
MNTFAMSDADARGFLAIGIIIISLALGIFWMVVFWRAMRAHERIAAAHEALSRVAAGFAVRFTNATPEEMRTVRENLLAPAPPVPRTPPPEEWQS